MLQYQVDHCFGTNLEVLIFSPAEIASNFRSEIRMGSRLTRLAGSRTLSALAQHSHVRCVWWADMGVLGHCSQGTGTRDGRCELAGGRRATSRKLRPVVFCLCLSREAGSRFCSRM